MTKCADCGAKRGGPLCPACTKTAAALGHTAEQRLTTLGHSLEIVLAAEAGVYKEQSKAPFYFASWWASRALHDDSLSNEDREMALAAYARSFDVQMGTTKGPKGGIHPGFPNPDGTDFLREAEARRAADAEPVADDFALFPIDWKEGL